MKILIDIGHAGHVHYYKNLMLNPAYADLKYVVIARNKYPITALLDYYKIEYIIRKEGGRSKLGKLLYLIYGNFFIFFKAIKHKPTLLLSHGGVYTALASFLLRTKTMTTEDTEGAKLSHKISRTFSDFIVTPNVMPIDFGKKQYRFNSYMEYAYLYPTYFKRDESLLKKYKLNIDTKYILIRLVDWSAHHDFGVSKLSNNDKFEIITNLAEKYQILLSYETTVPKELEKYCQNILPEDLHHLLAFAALYIGEGATTASEASILGTPAIYINPMQVCYCRDQEINYELSFNLMKKDDVLKKSHELLSTDTQVFLERAKKMSSEKIDTTKYIYDLIKEVT